VKSEPPKSPPMEVGCELQLLSGGGRVVFITDSSLAVGLKNRQWKLISTGGSLKTTTSGISLAVRLHQLPVEPISSGGCVKITASGNRFPLAVPKPGPSGFFYWRAVTETASGNLWVPQALSSFLVVSADVGPVGVGIRVSDGRLSGARRHGLA
jgi:hypothetical protein